MQLFEFSLQRLAGLQAESVATGLAIKRYHWSSLLRIGVFALLSNTQTALATMSTPLIPRIVVFFFFQVLLQLDAVSLPKFGSLHSCSSAIQLDRLTMDDREWPSAHHIYSMESLLSRRYKFVMLWLAQLLQSGGVALLPEGVQKCFGVRLLLVVCDLISFQC
jgi:hypothetical protein